MNYTEKADSLLTSLSRHIGVEEPQHLNKYGEAWMQAKGKKFLFRLNGNQRELSVTAYITLLGASRARRTMLRELLYGNFVWANTGEGVLSLDSSTGWVCLSSACRLDAVTESSFNSSFLRLLGHVEYWRNLLSYMDVDNYPKHATQN